jgi:MFS family permease
MTESDPTKPAAVPPPRWFRLAWFLGRPPPLTQRQWLMLGLVSAVSFFESYDLYLFSLNLKQIQAGLGIDEASLGTLGSFVRIGSMLALFIMPFADRFGRRRALLGTVIAYTVTTALTALSPNAETFVVLQLLSRIFAVAEELLAAVVIVEEFAPEHRGWGIGAMSAIQACGSGAAALMFSFVDVLPFGWRAMYAIGVVPLCFVAYWRRALPETDYFESMEQSRRKLVVKAPLLSSLWHVAREHPKNFWLLSAAFFFLAVASSSAGFFQSKYLQDVHHWTPGDVSLLTVVGGGLAIIGNPLSGWLSDRFGRRPTGTVFSVCFCLTLFGFYSVVGLFVPVMWVAYVFFSMGFGVTLTTYSAELFPTSMRSSAGGATNLISTVGGIVGLLLVSALYAVVGSNWTAILVVASLSLLVPPLIYFFFPETARRSLEDIAPESFIGPDKT